MKKLLAGLLFLAVPVFGEDWIPQPIGPFGTLNDTDNSYAIPSDKAQSLLNVDVTPGGKSVKKREGYGLAATLTVTTSPVHGIYNFYDSNGNDVSLYFNDAYLTSSISGSSPSVIFSTQTNGATWQCTDSLGFAYCANSNRTMLIKTNGVSYSHINPPSTGTMVAVSPTRLIQAGFSDAPSRIDFSKEADFTTWTAGSGGSDATQFTINAPGAKITHIVYAFGRLIWFKDTSFGYILIGNQTAQADWVIKTVSFDVGTNDNTSVYREGLLYFRGKDSDFYVFDGSNYKKISEDIATTIGLTQTRASNSWTQTSQSDFALGISSPTTFLSTSAVSGSVVISTTNSVLQQVDTTSANFVAGSLTTVSTTTPDGSLTLSLGSEAMRVSVYPGADDSTCGSPCTASYYQSRKITAASDFVLSSLLMRLKKTGSPGNYTVQFLSDSGGPSVVLDSATLTASSVGTSIADSTVTFLGAGETPLSISNGTAYWVRLVPGGTCDGSNKIEWYGTGTSPDSANAPCGSSASGSTLYAYRLNGQQYSASGNLVSRAFDVGYTTNTRLWNWCELGISGDTRGQTLTFETQSATDTTGIWDAVVSVSSNQPVASTVRRFLRYKASLATSNSGVSPRLDDVTMNACFIPNYLSQVKNASAITSWDTFSAVKQDNGGSHSFYIRSHATSFPATSSTITWTSISAGGVPTVSTGSSGVFFQVRDDFSITITTQNPKLDDFTQGWFEGNAADKAYATYFDDKIWWSVTNGEGATTNNKVLLYDLFLNGWIVYDFASNGFLTRNKSLYFGSAGGGYVYKFGDGNSDNGSAINSYWKSKDYFGSDPFVQTELANISVVAKSVQNSSTTITYAINGSSETAYTMNQYNPNGSFKISNKNLPGGKTGSSYSVKFGNNAADQPFEVFGIQVGIRPKSWLPQ